jgi:hypothetical protein
VDLKSAVDAITAYSAFEGALAALLHLERTGEGQLVTVNMLDAAIAVQMQEPSVFSPCWPPRASGRARSTPTPTCSMIDAPAGPAGIGSVLGGTGIAVSRSCTQLEAARTYIRLLLSEKVQLETYAEAGGQSADRRAWLDPAADARAAGFCSATRRTVESAWVRPRFARYLEFQARASAMLRDRLISGEDHEVLLGQVNNARYGAYKKRREDPGVTRRSG